MNRRGWQLHLKEEIRITLHVFSDLAFEWLEALRGGGGAGGGEGEGEEEGKECKEQVIHTEVMNLFS